MPPRARRPFAILLAAAVLAFLFYRFGIVTPDQLLQSFGASAPVPVTATVDSPPVTAAETPNGGSRHEVVVGDEPVVPPPPPEGHGQGAPAPEVATAEPEAPATSAPAPARPSAAVVAQPAAPQGVVRYPALTTQRDEITPDRTLWVEFAIAEMPVADSGEVKAGPGAATPAAGGVMLPPGKLDFTVSLTAKGFDILEGGDRQDFYMGPTGDSDRVRFVLKPKAGLPIPRTETISASLWRRGAFVAEITRQVHVASGIMSADATGLPSATPGNRPVSFVAILVSSDGSASLVEPHR